MARMLMIISTIVTILPIALGGDACEDGAGGCQAQKGISAQSVHLVQRKAMEMRDISSVSEEATKGGNDGQATHVHSAQPTQIAAMSFSHRGQGPATDTEPAHLDTAGVEALQNLLLEAAEIEKGKDMTNTGTAQALADIKADVDGETDPTLDVAPSGKNHEAVLAAIQEVSADIDVEQSIEKGALLTIDMLEAINGQAGTPEDADLTGTPDSMTGGMVVEGDMIAENQTQLALLQQASKNGQRWAGSLWPNGLIRFCFAGNAGSRIKKSVRDAKAYIEKNSCIQMEEVGFARSGQCSKSGVVVQDGGGCSSYVGIISSLGGGAMTLNSRGCTSLGTVVHEFLHALGQTHEQSRTDRDKYVQILWQNIQPGKEHNFRVERQSDDAIPYDYSSLMHYGATDFGINAKTTIKSKGHSIGNRQGMSSADKNQLSRMYCGGKRGKGRR